MFLRQKGIIMQLYTAVWGAVSLYCCILLINFTSQDRLLGERARDDYHTFQLVKD
jgi:hypothetical protein